MEISGIHTSKVQNIETHEINTVAHVKGNKDTAVISPLSALLARSGLAFSNIQYQNNFLENVSFSFQYSDSSNLLISMNGLYRKERFLSLNIVVETLQYDGSNFIKEQFSVSIDATLIHQRSTTPFTKKESIVEFVQKLINRIQELAMDGKTLIGTLEFEKEDLIELSSIEEGKLLKLLYEFVESVNYLVRMKEAQNENSEHSLAILRPQREIISGIITEEENTSSLSIRMEQKTFTAGVNTSSSTEGEEETTSHLP